MFVWSSSLPSCLQASAVGAVCKRLVAHIVDRVVLQAQVEELQVQLQEFMYGFEDEEAGSRVLLLQVSKRASLPSYNNAKGC